MLQSKKEVWFFSLTGIFITSAIVAEFISCKSINLGLYDIIAGILPWPIVFVLTDVLNEYVGKKAVQRLSWITTGLIAFSFLLVLAANYIPATPQSFVSQKEFSKVFGSSLWIMAGSICAFLLSQLIDIQLFQTFNNLTKGKHIWLRSTGSTVISQFVDTFTVAFIGLYLSGTMTFDRCLYFVFTGYATKLIIAVFMTPVLYVVNYYLRKVFHKQRTD